MNKRNKKMEYIDHVDDGYCRHNCSCGAENSCIELGEVFTCKGCGKKKKVEYEITIKEIKR